MQAVEPCLAHVKTGLVHSVETLFLFFEHTTIHGAEEKPERRTKNEERWVVGWLGNCRTWLLCIKVTDWNLLRVGVYEQDVFLW